MKTHCHHGHNIESDDSVYQYVSKQNHRIRQCKICIKSKNDRRKSQLRANHLLRAFGVTLGVYDEMLAAQGGKCKVCRTTEPGGYGNRSFHFDHDRGCCPGKNTCGKCLRGLLCSDCNTTLGLVKDNPDTLRALIAYLAKYSGAGVQTDHFNECPA